MLRYLLILLFFIAVSTQSKAQERVFHAGLLGGFTASQVINDSFSGYNKLGIYAGGFISTDFNDLISGEIGMIYSQKGSKEPNRKGQVYNGYRPTLVIVDVVVG